MPLFNPHDSPAALRDRALKVYTTNPPGPLLFSGDFTKGPFTLVRFMCNKALSQRDSNIESRRMYEQDLDDLELHKKAPLYLAELAHFFGRQHDDQKKKELLIKHAIYHYITFMNDILLKPHVPEIQQNILSRVLERVTHLIELVKHIVPSELQHPQDSKDLQRVLGWCFTVPPLLLNALRQHDALPAVATTETEQPTPPPHAAPPVAFRPQTLQQTGQNGQTRYRFDPYSPEKSFVYV